MLTKLSLGIYHILSELSDLGVLEPVQGNLHSLRSLEVAVVKCCDEGKELFVELVIALH